MNPGKCIPLMDNGHYHPTEVVSDKNPGTADLLPGDRPAHYPPGALGQ